ncbi:4Fe-4S ferredoxin [Gracilibacillus boraciitolerans JCM 21714]|uniref:4Fe-4S ferredoxin n=1 Tax=Gracilibacillus boraciitolerans JCM 21714 TaxID=1298598 RepID=W4VE11_9BACI|nr:4Fe-4S ferredoxin [Gracilibacillus boraciitolerans JCM 21714]
MFYIDPDICIDCGACEAVCPVEAIYMEDEVPDNENEYIALNHKFFEEK